MYNFKLNGKDLSVDEDISLIDYLRDVEQLTSVKNGCAEGACGACMVLVNGVAQRACIQKISRLENKEVLQLKELVREKETLLLMHLVNVEQFNVDFVFQEWL